MPFIGPLTPSRIIDIDHESQVITDYYGGLNFLDTNKLTIAAAAKLGNSISSAFGLSVDLSASGKIYAQVNLAEPNIHTFYHISFRLDRNGAVINSGFPLSVLRILSTGATGGTDYAVTNYNATLDFNVLDVELIDNTGTPDIKLSVKLDASTVHSFQTTIPDADTLVEIELGRSIVIGETTAYVRLSIDGVIKDTTSGLAISEGTIGYPRFFQFGGQHDAGVTNNSGIIYIDEIVVSNAPPQSRADLLLGVLLPLFQEVEVLV